MNYSDLREVMKHIKRVVICNNCKKRFLNEELQIVSTFQNEGLFHAFCHICLNQLLIHATIINQAHKPGEITRNEVLDMHNFLNQFNGDFSQLFTV